MQRMIKKFICLGSLALLGLPSAWAFSLAGPVGNGGDAWQTAAIGWGPPTDFVAAKNIGEGYRRNIPVSYYSFTPAFLDYFGTVGASNVDAAYGLLNNALTNGVSSYSQGLTEVPTDPQYINYSAQSLGIIDLKSLIVSMMMSEVGLADPEEFVWKLHGRYLPPGGKCPMDEEYLVIQRNFDINPLSASVADPYSSYINDVQYSFEIEDACKGVPTADTVTFPTDPFADSYTTVAGYNYNYGTYYDSLSQDDIAGLRYLMNTNNVNWESVGQGSLLFNEVTNTTAGEVLFPVNANTATGYGTFNLGTLLQTAQTTAPAGLPALFPGLIVNSSYNYYIVTNIPTVSSYYKVPYGSPYGSPPELVVTTNYTPTLQEEYVTTFGNVITNYYLSNSPAILQTITTGPLYGSPYGGPVTTTTTNYTKITLTNVPTGSFYILPEFGTNLCGSGIIYTGLTSVIYTTNLVTTAATNTGVVTATNSGVYSYTRNLITWYTNYTYVAYNVNCSQTAGAAGLYEGIDKLQYVRADYDSLLGQFFQPFTNGFSMVLITNSQRVLQHFDREVTGPDFVMDAKDLASGNGALADAIYQITDPIWNQANILPGLAGPGTIDPGTTFTFNKVGDIYLNGSLATYGLTTNYFLYQNTQVQLLSYGDFDGSTNPVVVYPSGSSIQNLQYQLVIQVSPTTLADGTVGTPYPSVQFSATGGAFSPPFTWSASSMAPGMSLSSAGVLSGTPTLAGTYDFNIILTDSLSRSVQWFYTLIIQ
jgi:hypothetical protein